MTFTCAKCRMDFPGEGMGVFMTYCNICMAAMEAERNETRREQREWDNRPAPVSQQRGLSQSEMAFIDNWLAENEAQKTADAQADEEADAAYEENERGWDRWWRDQYRPGFRPPTEELVQMLADEAKAAKAKEDAENELGIDQWWLSIPGNTLPRPSTEEIVQMMADDALAHNVVQKPHKINEDHQPAPDKSNSLWRRLVAGWRSLLS